jgi:hypothetical protein
MEDINDNLTIKEVANLLRWSKLMFRTLSEAESQECLPLLTCRWVGEKLYAANGSKNGWKATKRVSMQICQNALSMAQEREILMRRKRFQKGLSAGISGDQRKH